MSLLESDEVTPTHTSLLSVLPCNKRVQKANTHGHSHPHVDRYPLSLSSQSVGETQKILHTLYIVGPPHTHTHRHISHMRFNLGQLWKAARLWVKSSITPRGEECLVDHKRIWKQNTQGFRQYHCTSHVGLNFLLFSVLTAFYAHSDLPHLT